MSISLLFGLCALECRLYGTNGVSNAEPPSSVLGLVSWSLSSGAARESLAKSFLGNEGLKDPFSSCQADVHKVPFHSVAKPVLSG